VKPAGVFPHQVISRLVEDTALVSEAELVVKEVGGPVDAPSEWDQWRATCAVAGQGHNR
jgi:hypothetical protein